MEHKSLITELTQGKEMAIQLKTHLPSPPPPGSSPQALIFLTEMIQSSFENALLLLNWNPKDPSEEEEEEEEEEPTKNKRKNSTRDVLLKRRKLLPKWTEEVKVSSGSAAESPLNDGYSWRKYGQKDIHGANFPRCYYRCTHRNVRGCLATKQVQKSDNDPNIFEVTYRGRHTCNQSANLGLISVSNRDEIPEETHQNQQNPNSEIIFNFGDQQHFGLKTEDFDNVFPPFSFGSETVDENVFLESMMEPGFVADGNWSAAAVSSATSETAWDFSGYGGEIQGVQSSEQSNMTEMVSATTSVTNSPIGNGDWDLSLDKVDFDQFFHFDCLDFIS
ncbi:probable WRKY transcription factor 46 [Cucurbita pepo subsp. pepo]|uniref:probable WRKY transcription factor 46 n=1 Tax=Cucurbita pepo subsp. pepo TaxID=3664 RepID=UPI000C9D33D2|nr:probable WRKY transcription factor 46 [Cucurbita pepo subsp. pepo]